MKAGYDGANPNCDRTRRGPALLVGSVPVPFEVRRSPDSGVPRNEVSKGYGS